MRKLFTLFAAAIVAATMYATEGALPGAFTINKDGDKIQFAQGNLQYQESTEEYYLADEQWKANMVLEAGEILLADEAKKEKIYKNIWRLLTIEEWHYLLEGRNNAANLRGAATVNGVEGYLLLPDNWTLPQGLSFTANGSTTDNIYTLQKWATMQNAGAVFLPQDGSQWRGELLYSCYLSSSTRGFSMDMSTYSTVHIFNFQADGSIGFNVFGFEGYERFYPDDGPDYTINYNNSLYGSFRLVTEVTFSTVTFKDWDGTVLKTEEVNLGADATAPATPVREGYTFVGWDAVFTNVWSDLTVTAIYSKPLTGRFSVAADKQVIFAQGNLQYKASDNKWAFSDKQYDMIGYDNANISSSYNGWIDLFGWGTAANPTETSKESAPYTSFTDWTTNTIENADGKTWYTMPEDEWNYLLSTRAGAADKHGQAVVNDVKGYILLPDEWSLPEGLSFTATPYNYTTNIYTASQWEKLEAAGAVFLPAAGFRYGIDINGLSAGNGYYWTSTPSSQYADMAQALMISEYSKAKVNFGMPCYGYSVRPVREPQASEGIDPVTGNPSPVTHKFLRNGVLYIEMNGKTYNAQGIEIK